MELNDMPISNISWIDVEELKANDYNPNVVLKREMNLLKLSIIRNGWIQPILINKDYEIIDGYHRVSAVRMDKQLRDFTNGKVPCAVLDLDEPSRMLLTIRINRAKGNHVAFKMHDVITTLVNDYNVSIKRICKEIGATPNEVKLLLQENIFAEKGINDESTYSKAWIPKYK